MTTVAAATQKMDFMKLLITELQNQNPLEPMDNQQMAAQMAQFSQLELTEQMNTQLSTINTTMGTMNTSFQGAMTVAKLDYAKSLLGKQVSFYEPDNCILTEGNVGKIEFVNGEPVLRVTAKVAGEDQEYYVGLDGLVGIQ